MDTKPFKYTNKNGEIIECGVVPTGKNDNRAFLVLFDEHEPHSISMWDDELNNIRYEIPEWLAFGIRDLIANHEDCVEINIKKE